MSDPLLEGVERFLSSLSSEEDDAELSAPPFVVNDFEVELDLPGERVLDLGTARLQARPVPDGSYQLQGSLRPSVSGAIGEAVEVRVDGRQWGSRIRVHASARDVPFESTRLAGIDLEEFVPVAEFAGRLTFDAEAQLDFGEESAVTGSLRARLEDGRLLPVRDHPWLEKLELDLEADFHPEAVGDLWERESWTVAARLAGAWNETPILAFGELGSRVAPDRWAHVWARAERLPLERATLDALGARDYEELWGSLEPTGHADTAFDLVLRRNPGADPLERWETDLAVRLFLGGRAGMTYHGFPGRYDGVRRGIPLPITDLSGRAVFTRKPTLERPYRLGLIDLVGAHGTGPVTGWGQVLAPRPGDEGRRPEIDFSISVPELTLDDRLRAAFETNPGLEHIFEDYQPSGGRLESHWRLHSGPDTRGPTAVGTVLVRDTNLRWKELPVPLEDAGGELTFLWAKEPIPAGEDRWRRPWGVAFDVRNDQERDGPGVRAHVSGFIREEGDLPADGSSAPYLVPPEDMVQGLEIGIENLLLRGSDWDVFADRFPELGTQVAALNARGGFQVLYRGARARRGMPYVSDVEATPRQVEIQPAFFEVRTQDLEGRVHLHTESHAGRDLTSTSLALSGAWPGAVDLAVDARIPDTGTAGIRLFVAGLDPTSPSLKGAILSALAGRDGSEQELDLSETSLGGRVDVTARYSFPVGPPIDDAGPPGQTSAAGVRAPPDSVYRIHLRHNTLEQSPLRLKELRGTLEQRDGVLSSPLVRAELVDHPLELRNFLAFYLEDAARLPEADPLLLRSGFVDTEGGMAMQAEVHTEGLPLDEAHLSSLLSEDTLELFRDSVVWRGQIDVLGAHILLTGPGSDGKLVLHGAMRPHDLAMRLGLPITIGSARLDLREFVRERDRFRAWGQISGLDATLAERELEDAQMTFNYVDGRLTIDDLLGAFEGGTLESLGAEGSGARKALGIDLVEPYRFDVALRLADVQVDRLLRGVFQSTIADEGRLSGSIEVSGTPGDVLGLSGGGTLQLDEGRLWSIPVMRELFAQLGFSQTGVFDEMRARFELRNGVISAPYVLTKSPLLYLLGAGTLDLDGTMHFDLEARYSLLDRLGILNRVVYWLNRSLWRVAVRGDFQRPRVKIRNAFMELFRGFEDRPPRSLPLPPFAPLGRNF